MKIPEGATHFNTDNNLYYKVEDGVAFFYNDVWRAWVQSLLPYDLLDRYSTKINKEPQVFSYAHT